MGIYARRPWRLARQVAGDLFLIVWTVLWWLAGRAVGHAVGAVADPARQIGDASRTLAGQLGQAAEQAGRIPGLGRDLRSPLDDSSRSLGDVTAAANQLVATIERSATVLGWVVFLIPVVLLLVVWLPARIRFFRQAGAAQRFLDGPADLDLFALRAMASQPMHVLAQISDDPVAAWRRGDRAVINALAAAELRRSGLRPPPAPSGLDA